MPVLQLDDQQFPLKAGATRIGVGADADVKVPGTSALSVDAVIDGGGTPTIRRAADTAYVKVNGVVLGAEPTPLMHGDKVEIAGLELRYADDAKGGATQFVSASDIAALAGAKRTGAARATAASGGRVVSLVDGKEYSIADSGLVFGRDASCDVVVPQNEVSRRHAEIVPGEQGYLLRDMSANGIFVNGERIQGSHRLARADVVRIGTEEYRFYADLAAAAAPSPRATPPATAAVPPVAASAPSAPAAAPPKPPPPPPAPVAAPAPPPASPAQPTAPAAASASDLLEMDLLPMEPVASPPHAVPAHLPPPAAAPAPAPVAPVPTPAAAAHADPRPVLAVLESLNEGPGKGTRYELRTPLGHIGRGAHNDVRLSDESVSETHAKLQRREDGWYVVDMDSTNGTYLGGTRVAGERRIEGSPDLRFGGMKFRFTIVGAGSSAELETKGTRAIAAMTRPPDVAPKPAAKAPTPSAPSPAPVPAEATKSGGIPVWVWIVVALVLAGVAFFVLKGRA